MNLSADLVHSLTHHTRRSEQAIGVDFDSELVNALYGCLVDMTLEDIAKKVLRVSLVTYLNDIKEKSEELRGKKLKKKEYLKQAKELIKQAQLAAAMMEQLNG
jgi:hypothetical protein